MGLSLWIVPNEKEALTLEPFMIVRQNNDSTSLTPASYPKFYPHITLASLPLELENNLDAIEAGIQKLPIRCSFVSVETGDHYFRSVYVTIGLTSDLLVLHDRLHKALGVEPRTPSFPHMSLCYIDDTDAANGERMRFYEDLKKTGNMSISQGGSNQMAGLNCGFFSGKDVMDHFDAHEVWAVRCEGPVKEWTVIKKFAL